MWPRTPVTDALGITYPIIQAPMAGGPAGPALVAAVANAGGLGSLGAATMPPDQIRAAIQEIRRLTDRPFAVNLFAPQSPHATPEAIARMQALLQPYRAELGLGEPSAVTTYGESFEAQITVVLEERVPIFSFTFGIPPAQWLQALHANRAVIIGTATSVREARALEASGVDMIAAQGSEAGGHRGTFLGGAEEPLIGTLALVPQVVDAVGVPVIAAGGIADGRGIVAALALGAAAAQLGTAFLACPESGASPLHKEALLHSGDESTTVTRVFTGRSARGLRNRYTTELAAHRDEVLDYPVQGVVSADIRRAAASQGRVDLLALWAGQAVALCTTKPAGELVADLAAQAADLLRRLSS